MKNFCDSKATFKKVKRQPIGWEKYLQIIYLISPESRIQKELLPLNNKKINNPVKNQAQNLHRYFSKKIHRYPKNHEKMFDIINLLGNEIKATMRYHFMLNTM